jgi:signal transduction histidine kinase
MSAAPKSVRLVTIEIRFEQDVVLARQRARELAHALGFEGQVQTSIATAVSEIARNAFRYAGGGRAAFSVVTEPHPAKSRLAQQTFVIEVRDNGPGISNLENILEGRYESKTGLGIGLIGTQRLVDRFDISSAPGNTTVTLAKILPPSAAPRSPREIQGIVDDLSRRPPSSPLDELQIQNQELLTAMEEARQRQDELARVNQELAETNTGVLALYDELETLNRISMMLASKLELKPLIQSIVDVTTNLTDAQIGAFFFHDDDHKWRLYATSGSKAFALADFPATAESGLFSDDFKVGGLEHVRDLAAHAQPCAASKFAVLVAGEFDVASCLTVPVADLKQSIIGVFVFASESSNVFSERSERILASVATQAAVGIENARLFQTVSAASEAKDKFFATLSHELRTPLNPALVIASSMEVDARVPEDLRPDIAVIARNIRLEARLIDDLLDFNRLVKGKLEITTSPVDVHELIPNVVEICREDLTFKRQQIALELRGSPSTVMGESARLQQVLWNVLKNAIKFTPRDGFIRIRTEAAGNLLRIEIIDTGRGIDRNSVERIFSAFDQGHEHQAAHFGGLGLGLSIARMFVTLHHGTIKAASPGIGKGSTISIELPLCDEKAHATTAPVTEYTPAAGHGRILLVDDHADTLRSLARLLNRKGFEVTTAVNAMEAIAAAEESGFDILISDLGLPGCSGLELVAKVGAVQSMPAIALSGYGMEADVKESQKAGFQIHMTKPVEFEELVGAINSLLAKESN